MPRYPKAKKVYANLKYPSAGYFKLKSALHDNPGTVESDYHVFDSQMEYERYLYLLSCETSGEISGLIPHPGTYEVGKRITLPKNAIRTKATRYKQHRVYTPDFYYRSKGIHIYEDFKGYKASAGASLQHHFFIQSLIDSGISPKDFHFKIVTVVTADPSQE